MESGNRRNNSHGGRGRGQNQGGGRGSGAPQSGNRPPVQDERPPSQPQQGFGRSGPWTPRPWGPPRSPLQQLDGRPRAPPPSPAAGQSQQLGGRPWAPSPSPAAGQSQQLGGRPWAPPPSPAAGQSQQLGGRPWAPPPSPAAAQSQQVGGRPGAWGQSPRGPPSRTFPAPVQTSPPVAPQPSVDEVNMKSLTISEQPKQSLALSVKEANPLQPIRRPDRGGTISIKSINLLVNHFPVTFDPQRTIIHYDVDIKALPSNGDKRVRKLRQSDLRLIRDKLFADNPAQFPITRTTYDGEKNIFSAVVLPTGKFEVNIPDGEEVKGGTYLFTIKHVNELKLSKLDDYLRGNLSYVPRDILQGMDLVMKDNPSRQRICIGRSSFYESEYDRRNDLGWGVAAYKGFQQSLKPTFQGLALCLDYSILALRKPWPVLEFLNEHIQGFRGPDDVKRLRRDVEHALKGLKVRVTHRRTKQKYTIASLTALDACRLYFELVEGENPPQNTSLLKYFKDKWGKDVMYPNIPCLELGKGNRSNQVPLEFCVLVEGQRYPKENLDKNTALFLKNLTLAKPGVRKRNIDGMVNAQDGPFGDVAHNFGIELDVNMTRVTGRVIGPPVLKLGASRSVQVDAEKRQWNLIGKSVVDGKPLDRWVLLDLTDGDRYNRLQANAFVNSLRGRCRNLGIRMEEPLLYRVTRMNELSDVSKLENLLRGLVEEASRIDQGKLQMIVCVMTRKDPGYKSLKWVSETRIGVVTQCCLSSHANKGQDQYLANLCLKINAKLGGSNFELIGKLPHFENENHVMFIGADVNHSGPMDSPCPSIAAVVGTMNWPAANRYAARVCPQTRRTEKILNFGKMCLDLIKTYTRLNKARPTRIVVFRDGVSEGQFEMVLAQELLDLKNAIYDDHYKPAITLIVAQKRHQTRLFVQDGNDAVSSGNVPPGTVVDTKIVHPLDFDFYLCSHYGGLGTSKPTHYYVLWDENGFTSNELQKLIYDLCFTFVRCTKPVSLVPPVYYADLVAYRGRMFQEAMTDTRSPSSAYPFASSSSSSTASFEQSFYNLHSDLENIMFFV